MFTFDVRMTGVQETIDRLNRLQQELGDKVIVRALNDTVAQARTQISRRIREEYAIDAATVRERLQIQRAKRNGMQFTATLIGNPAGRAKRAMNVIRFVDRKTTLRAWKKARGGSAPVLHVKIRRAGAAKPLAGAFIGNKGRTVFRRLGKERLPIEAVQTIGVPQMFQAKKVQLPVQRWIEANFPRIFDRHARYLLTTIK